MTGSCLKTNQYTSLMMSVDNKVKRSLVV